jgi:hypothetical protein
MIRAITLASAGLSCLVLTATSVYAQNVSREVAWARCVKAVNATTPKTGEENDRDRIAEIKACLTDFGYPNG